MRAASGAPRRARLDRRPRRSAAADDAMVLDTTGRDVDDVVAEIVARFEAAGSPVRSTRFYRFMRFFVVGYVRVLYRVRVVGREHVPKAGPYIIAPSHRSMLDIPFAARSRRGASASWARRRCSGAGARDRSAVLGGFPVEHDGTDLGPFATRCASSSRRTARRLSRRHPPARPQDRSAAAGARLPRGEGRRADRARRYRGRRGDVPHPSRRLPGFGRIVVWSASQSSRRCGRDRSSSARRSTSFPARFASASRSSSTRRTSSATEPADEQRQPGSGRLVCRSFHIRNKRPAGNRFGRGAGRYSPSWVRTSEASTVRSEPNGPPRPALRRVAADRERSGRVERGSSREARRGEGSTRLRR